MPIEFSFLALTQIILALLVVVFFVKTTKPLIQKFIMVYIDELGDKDKLNFQTVMQLIRWKWFFAFLVTVFLLATNPFDLTISDNAERQKQKEIKKMFQKKTDIPPRVQVEKRTLDKAMEKFDNSVDSTRIENAREQQLSKEDIQN